MGYAMSKDYYEILGISQDASEADIKQAYRRMAMKYHPDRNTDSDSTEKFKEITQAYEILSDAQKRRAYDQFGQAGVDQMGGAAGGAGGFGDMFNDIFSDIFGGAAGRRGPARGADLRYNLELTLEDAVHGTNVTIQVPTWVACNSCQGTGAEKGSKPVTCHTCQGHGQVRMQQGFFSLQQTCPTCRGAGQIIKNPCRACRGHGRVQEEKKLNVKIPPGVDNGDRVRLNGEGEAAPQGGVPGDLYVEVHIKEHAIFQREGQHLYCEVPISIIMAALGGDIEIPTLDSKVKLHIPTETQTGKVFKIPGKGVRSVRSSATGDLMCRVIVETPVDLNRKQRELLREFEKETQSHKHSPRVSKWFERMKDFIEKSKK